MNVDDIFGTPDDLKFRSSMTLFDAASERRIATFRQAITRYFDGDPDRSTLDLLSSGARE